MDENKMPENDGWKKNARLAIYAMAGFYLLTLAYQMFRAISTSHGNEQLVMIVATILFLIVGVGLIGFGTINVYKNMKKNCLCMRQTLRVTSRMFHVMRCMPT